jgi:hypothetical protein
MEYMELDSYNVRRAVTKKAPARPALRLSAHIRVATIFEPCERAQIILSPAALLRFEPKKSPYANGHDSDVERMVNRKNHEIVGENQGDVNQRANAEDQQMNHDTDF